MGNTKASVTAASALACLLALAGRADANEPAQNLAQFSVDRIWFAANEAVLDETNAQLLDAMARDLASHPEWLQVSVSGFASQRGDATTEKKREDLSLRRARAVVQALVARGIAADRFIIQAFGSSRANDETKSRLERRVVLAVTDVEPQAAAVELIPNQHKIAQALDVPAESILPAVAHRLARSASKPTLVKPSALSPLGTPPPTSALVLPATFASCQIDHEYTKYIGTILR